MLYTSYTSTLGVAYQENNNFLFIPVEITTFWIYFGRNYISENICGEKMLFINICFKKTLCCQVTVSNNISYHIFPGEATNLWKVFSLDNFGGFQLKNPGNWNMRYYFVGGNVKEPNCPGFRGTVWPFHNRASKTLSQLYGKPYRNYWKCPAIPEYVNTTLLIWWTGLHIN